MGSCWILWTTKVMTMSMSEPLSKEQFEQELRKIVRAGAVARDVADRLKHADDKLAALRQLALERAGDPEALGRYVAHQGEYLARVERAAHDEGDALRKAMRDGDRASALILSAIHHGRRLRELLDGLDLGVVKAAGDGELPAGAVSIEEVRDAAALRTLGRW